MNIIEQAEKIRADLIKRVEDSYCEPNRSRALKALKAPISLNKRMRTSAGRAFRLELRIELNQRLFEKPSNSKNIQGLERTVIHEFAHLMDWLMYGNFGHGATWKRIMRKMGQPDHRCHNLDTTGLKRRHKTIFLAECDCSDSKPIRRKWVNHIRKGGNVICKTCESRVSIVGETVNWLKTG